MKRIFTLFAFIFIGAFSINAQEEVSIGASYSNQAYYTLADGETTTLANDSWDLAFAVGFAKAGILYNESANYGGTKMEMYLAPTNDFSDTFDPNQLTDSLYNAQDSWQNGAFNVAANPSNPFDMGWGDYDPSTHAINGTRVFAVKLRDDSWRKVKIISLAMGSYTVKYANVDGTNEITTTILKSDYSGSPFAYFSFKFGTTTASPANWDLYFGRYVTPLNASGSIIPYTVAGVLAAPGVQVAQANGIAPSTVNYEDYLDSLTEQIDVIGHDWKDIDFSSNPPAWFVFDDRAYFVKTADNHLWKMIFWDFEGKSTGNCVFSKTDLGVVTGITDPTSNFTALGVYPNPIVDDYTVSFSLQENRPNMNISIVSNIGQTVWSARTNGHAGLNILQLQAPSVSAGTYHLMIGSGNDITTTTLLLK